MRGSSLIGTVVLGVALALASPAAQQKKADTEAAINDVVRNYVAARERANAAELGALFTADADQLTSSGEWRRGRDELVKGTLASSKSNAGARTITIKTVHTRISSLRAGASQCEIKPTGAVDWVTIDRK